MLETKIAASRDWLLRQESQRRRNESNFERLRPVLLEIIDEIGSEHLQARTDHNPAVIEIGTRRDGGFQAYSQLEVFCVFEGFNTKLTSFVIENRLPDRKWFAETVEDACQQIADALTENVAILVALEDRNSPEGST